MPAVGSLPYSSVSAYATGADMVASRDYRALGDLITDPATAQAPQTRLDTQAAVIANFNAVDAIGYRALRWASAQIEAAVTMGQRYKPEDLQMMTQLQVIPAAQGGNGTDTAYTVGRDLLVGLCCDLAFWWLTKRRKPGARAQDVAGVWDALGLLDGLAKGERIFPFAETQTAGLPEVSPLDAAGNVVADAVPITQTAARFFGMRSSLNRY